MYPVIEEYFYFFLADRRKDYIFYESYFAQWSYYTKFYLFIQFWGNFYKIYVSTLLVLCVLRSTLVLDFFFTSVQLKMQKETKVMWYHVRFSSISCTVDSCYSGVKSIFKAQMKVQPFFSNLQVLPTELEANHSQNCGLPLYFPTDSHP